MDVILVSYRYGSTSQSTPAPYVAFLPAGLDRPTYLELRGEIERPGFLLSAEVPVTLPDGSVDLSRPYDASGA